LASYPRSGNTLIRTILKQTMGLDSYSDDLGVKELGITGATRAEFGDMPLGMSWDDFYSQAVDSPDLYLVKTHLPPRDNQPVIYIVRDGRQSIFSYWHYHQRFHQGYSTGLMNLIVGCDYYGDWSGHYSNWFAAEDRKILLLRFEDLLQASPELIQEIASFIGYQGCPADWLNIFDKLHEDHPSFFRAGSPDWQSPGEWSEFVNGGFFLLHGELMCQLGYVNSTYIDESTGKLSPELRELLLLTQHISKQKRGLEDVCVERQRVIDDLLRVCDERLRIIQKGMAV